MADSRGNDCRDDIALIAHRDGSVLILQVAGYANWRLPQGPLRPGLDDIPKRERQPVIDEIVRDFLEERVGTRDAGAIRYTGVDRFVYYAPGTAITPDMTVTANMHPSKKLHFYIAEFYPEAVLKPQGRINAFRFVHLSALKTTDISLEERDGVEKVASEYSLDPDAQIEIDDSYGKKYGS